MSRLYDFINKDVLQYADFYHYCLNPNIPMSELKKIQYPYSVEHQHTSHPYTMIMIQSKHFDIDSIINFKHVVKSDWENISKHCSITPEFIINNPELPWHYRNVLLNPNLTEDLVMYVLDKLGNEDSFLVKYCKCFDNVNEMCLCYERALTQIFENPNLSIEFIKSLLRSKRYVELQPYMYAIENLVTNPNFKPEMIYNYEYVTDDFEYISEYVYDDIHIFNWLSINPNLTFDFILAEKDQKWEWRWLAFHPNIKYEHIYNEHNLPWDISVFWSANPNITVQNLEKHKTDSFIMKNVYKNKYIPIEFILSNFNLNWEWNIVAINPYLTVEDFKVLSDVLLYPGRLSQNLMTFDPVVYSKHICSYIYKTPIIISGLKNILCQYV